MSLILMSLLPENTLQIPQDPISLLGWLVWFGLLVFLAVRLRNKDFKLNRRSLIWLALLSVLVLLVTPFLGVAVRTGAPQNALESDLPQLMIFAAVPFVIAGGILGLVPSMLLAGISGTLLAYLNTHHIFTPLLFMTAALIFTLCVRQCYRTFGYRLLRFPLAAALVTDLFLAPLTFIALILESGGDLTTRMITALDRFPGAFLALAGMVLVGGLVGVVVRALAGEKWGRQVELQPAPGEQNLQFRFIMTVLPLALILWTALAAGNWTAAVENARRELVQQMTGAAGLAADGLPVFVDTGEVVIRQLATDERLTSTPAEALPSQMEAWLAEFVYFDELAYLAPDGALVAVTPPISDLRFYLQPAEQLAVQVALTGGTPAPVAIQPASGDQAARLSFIAAVPGAEGQAGGVLCGRTALTANRFSQPYLQSFQDIADNGGSAQIIDGNGTVLYHTNATQVMSSYTRSIFLTPTYYETAGVSMGQSLEFFQPLGSHGWAVVIALPVETAQRQALEAVTPVLLTGLGVIAAILLVALLALGRIQANIREISSAAEKVSRGELDIDLKGKRFNGEMKRLASAFQQMVGVLRSRMQKQSELLSVSERITGQLKLSDSLQVVLMAAMEHGVSSARVVLAEGAHANPDPAAGRQFGMGKHTQLLTPLDEDILELSQARGQFVMRDTQIVKRFHLGKGMPCPGLIIAMPLRWKDSLLGVFWIAYDDRTTLGEDEFAYFNDLAHKAATAVINTRTFDESLTVRKRMESILAEMQDPVIMADETGKVIYLNGAAEDLLGANGQKSLGTPLAALFEEDDLRAVMAPQDGQPQSKEVELANGKTYQVTVTPLIVDGRKMGLAGIFKDVSHYKQRDDLKTEFVTTVSHELRSPLILILGYAKILRLTSNLNEQQDTYIGYIIDGVEEMKALVSNLLDLGRLDSGDALALEEVAVSEIMDKVMGSMGAHARQKNIGVLLDLPEESVFIQADPIFLIQALKNLLDNAIMYSKSGQEVEVRVRKQEGDVVFAVQDNGPGIAPLDQRKIFKRFYKSDSLVDQDQRSGNGLGLSIVKSIAERHGGKVWFESKLGKGSTFYLRVPILQPKE